MLSGARLHSPIRISRLELFIREALYWLRPDTTAGPLWRHIQNACWEESDSGSTSASCNAIFDNVRYRSSPANCRTVTCVPLRVFDVDVFIFEPWNYFQYEGKRYVTDTSMRVNCWNNFPRLIILMRAENSFVSSIWKLTSPSWYPMLYIRRGDRLISSYADIREHAGKYHRDMKCFNFQGTAWWALTSTTSTNTAVAFRWRGSFHRFRSKFR